MFADSFEIDSFLNNKEINALLDFYEKLPKTLNDGDEKKAYTTGFPWSSMPIKTVKEKIKNMFGDCNITVAMFLEEYIPWGVHTDYLKDDDIPYYALLFPLDFEEKNTHTIIFTQQATEKEWKAGLREPSGYHYSDEQKQLLDHIDQDLLDKLSIDQVCKWKKGKMIAWHRKLLHTSDNFIKSGMKNKKALVLFMNKDD